MILAYDIGTSFLKGAVVAETGKILARAQVPIRLVESADRERYEWDPDAWLSGMALVAAQLGLREKGKLRGIVVSGNGPTLVAVDANCEPLALAMSWMDRRAREEAELIAEFTDAPVDPSSYLPKAFWLMRHEPELYEKTRHFLPCAEFIDFFLTGNPVRILPTELFREFFWHEGAVPRVRLDPEKLPPFVEPGELIGTVSDRAADILGLPSGVPVVAGGPDYVMSIIGTASLQPGRTCDRAGTTEGVNLCWSAPVRDPRLLCFPHVVRGSYNVSAMLSTSGSALDWAARNLGSHKPDVEALMREVQGIPAGADGVLFLPFLSPERFPIWDPKMRGAFIGLTLAHGRREMMRAVVESAGYAVRSVIAAMEAKGCQVADLRVTGSQARLPAWCQMRADVTGKKVLLSEQEDTELVGNACVGFFGLGDFEGLPAAAEALVRFQRAFVPEQGAAAVYDQMFARFTRASEHLGQALS